MVVAIYHASGK